jgi:NAD(P)H-flavin reductase
MPENAISIICGPLVMIHYGNRCWQSFSGQNYVTLEARSTADRQCGRCNLGEKLVCVDGPVFPWHG